MKIAELSQGLFFYGERVYLKIQKPANNHGIFAIRLLQSEHGFKVIGLINQEKYFKGEIQPIEITFQTKKNDRRFRDWWEFRDIAEYECFVPYIRDPKDQHGTILDEAHPELCIKWNSKKFLPQFDKPFYAINVSDGACSFQEPIWAHWMGQLNTWPVVKASHIELTEKKIIQQVLPEAV